MALTIVLFIIYKKMLSYVNEIHNVYFSSIIPVSVTFQGVFSLFYHFGCKVVQVEPAVFKLGRY